MKNQNLWVAKNRVCNRYSSIEVNLFPKGFDLGTIVDIDSDLLKIEIHQENLAQPQMVAFDLDRYNQLDYGYAATIHKSQGVTVDQVFILASQYLDRHATYVGMTRHRDNVELFSIPPLVLNVGRSIF